MDTEAEADGLAVTDLVNPDWLGLDVITELELGAKLGL